MGFRGEAYKFESPAGAVAAMVAQVRASRRSPGIETLGLNDSHGRVLAGPVYCDRDSPPFECSSMDGYAVRTSAIRPILAPTGDLHLPVLGEARIGVAPPAMPPGRGAIRVVTGAPLPSGADAVVKREDVIERADGTTITLPDHVRSRIRAGEFIRRRAENASAGAVVQESGVALTSAALGALGAVGAGGPDAPIRVFAPVRVSVITTGDEVAGIDESPTAFQIRNSNAPSAQTTLARRPWIRVVSVRHVRDEHDSLGLAFRDAAQSADAIVLTGGVSMGHHDHVRAVVLDSGATVIFHGLPQRPGKPLLGAVLHRSDGDVVPIFALPGNPVSTLVTCTRFVVPTLAARAGIQRWTPPPRVRVANVDHQALGLWWHRLARINDDGDAELIDARGSGDLIAAGRADGFVEIPPAGADPGALAAYPFYSWAI